MLSFVIDPFLVGYCHHKLCALSVSKNYFSEVLRFSESEPYDELVDPVEVYECLEESGKIYRNLKIIKNSYCQ